MLQSVNPKDPVASAKWTAGSVRHRTHLVTVRDGNIFVTLTSLDNKLDSDRYNSGRRETM